MVRVPRGSALALTAGALALTLTAPAWGYTYAAVGARGGQPLTPQTVATRFNDFGLNLLSAETGAAAKATAKAKAAAVNVFFSPISIAVALGMTALGTTSPSTNQDEFCTLFGARNGDELTEQFRVLNRVLKSELVTDVFTEANGLWARGLQQSFIDSVQEEFGAVAAALPDSVGPINQFVADKTDQKIQNILEHFDANTIVLLVNAVLFKGSWNKKFEKIATEEDGQFFVGSTQPVQLPMMRNRFVPSFLDGDDDIYDGDVAVGYAMPVGNQGVLVDVLHLPYTDNKFHLVIVLPAKDTESADGAADLQQVIQAVQTPEGRQGFAAVTNYRSVLAHEEKRMDHGGVEFEKVDVKMPRFKAEYGATDMIDTLKNLGLEAAFETWDGFARMTGGTAQITQVVHKATVEVDEEGTVAAAATVAVGGTRGGRQEEIAKFHVNRPFLIGIKEASTDLLLFLGAIVHPQTLADAPGAPQAVPVAPSAPAQGQAQSSGNAPAAPRPAAGGPMGWLATMD